MCRSQTEILTGHSLINNIRTDIIRALVTVTVGNMWCTCVHSSVWLLSCDLARAHLVTGDDVHSSCFCIFKARDESASTSHWDFKSFCVLGVISATTHIQAILKKWRRVGKCAQAFFFTLYWQSIPTLTVLIFSRLHLRGGTDHLPAGVSLHHGDQRPAAGVGVRGQRHPHSAGHMGERWAGPALPQQHALPAQQPPDRRSGRERLGHLHLQSGQRHRLGQLCHGALWRTSVWWVNWKSGACRVSLHVSAVLGFYDLFWQCFIKTLN